ncbi:hypothetical protein [Telmatospirillum sp. J64-1]|uniref:hypothetical protein n=1 Tax=Telmatospirillum sp. J64-1 TaxID=2502183 RepID=UPI00115D4999|nr:hypothetical protein [Telmatospirillum sp. J64-1]
MTSGFLLLSQGTPEWLPELEEQIFRDHDCAVVQLTNVRRGQHHGLEVLVGEVECEDGRSFDIFRRGDDDFRIARSPEKPAGRSRSQRE